MFKQWDHDNKVNVSCWYITLTAALHTQNSCDMCLGAWGVRERERERERERAQPWKVGGREPKLSASNSTESILYFGICSAIMGFAIVLAVLQIA